MGSDTVDTNQLLSRRGFMVQASVVAGSALLVSCGSVGTNAVNNNTSNRPQGFQLPPLSYHYNALEPYIDTQTMQLHHDKHHTTYVNNLNGALKNHPFATL